MKKCSIIFCFAIYLFCGLMISCGISAKEAVQGSDEFVEAGQLPILQVCPIEEPSVTNFFVDPIKVEEADNNIVVIDTNVDKVSVSLNSTYMGLSKITITDLLPGQFILDLSKEGYKSQRNFINVGKNRKSYFYFEMKKSE